MRKMCLFFLALSFLLFSCAVPLPRKQQDAGEMMKKLLCEFALGDGFLYSDARDAEYPLTDAVLARMFTDEGDTEDLFCVVSAAAWFSKRFSEQEILIFELCDRSHRERIVSLFQKRAKKKENAAVFSDGVFVYLICTDQNEAIRRYLQP